MNDAFCILPWIGFHVNTDGDVFPCCVSDHTMPYANIHDGNSIQEIYMNKSFIDVRRQMLNGQQPKQCSSCYKEETIRKFSPRISFNEGYDRQVKLTKVPISGKKRIHMLDIRFSNICNMKCRMCNSGFSSLWAQEERSRGKDIKTISRVDKKFIDEILELLPTVDHIYFAGGEPLITDEHYIILEEIQKQNLAEKIHLRYSTNLSVVQYKQKDLIDLWKGYKKIDLAASIDHFGERAEYIRHGTVWGTIEENIKKMQTVDNVELSISSTVNAFNYVTYNEFCDYMSKYFDNLSYFQMYPMHTPEYMTSQVLPSNLKKQGTDKLKSIKNLSQSRFSTDIDGLITFANYRDTWNNQKDELVKEIKLRDNIRGEDFCKTFPELKEILNA